MQELSVTAPLLRRQQILRSARRLWGRHGYHVVSLRRIAADAGVALTLIDHHFGSKQQLFTAVVESSREPFLTSVRRLQALKRDGVPLTVGLLVDCLSEPVRLLESSVDGQDMLHVALRHFEDTEPEVRHPMQSVFGGMAQGFRAAFGELFAQQTPARLAWAYVFTLSTVMEFAVRSGDGECSDAQDEASAPGDPLDTDIRQHFSTAEVRRLVVAALQATLTGTPGTPGTV